MKVQVSEGWQLDDESQPGDIIEVDDALGEEYIASGKATKAPSKTSAKSTSKARTAPNKSTEDE